MENVVVQNVPEWVTKFENKPAEILTVGYDERITKKVHEYVMRQCFLKGELDKAQIRELNWLYRLEKRDNSGIVNRIGQRGLNHFFDMYEECDKM